ncbi:CAF17-like 4Fe-4S cluster assembly/insertion protein YgfZ [Frateuria aurantia]
MPTTVQTLPAQIVEISGTDAIAFAHGQFSSHLLALEDGQWQSSAWLDPQGRVRYLLQLARLDAEHLVILLRGGDAAALAQALRPFVFRSKVVIAGQAGASISTGPALPEHTLQHDPASGTTRWGFGDYSMTVGPGAEPDLQWLERQTRAGLPWLPSEAQSTHVGAALSLHRLGALAIDKGCYPGQEIVARLHYRGGLKRHLALLESEHEVEPGAQVQIQETVMGQLLNPLPTPAGQPVLAVLNDGAEPDNYRVIQRWGA